MTLAVRPSKKPAPVLMKRPAPATPMTVPSKTSGEASVPPSARTAMEPWSATVAEDWASAIDLPPKAARISRWPASATVPTVKVLLKPKAPEPGKLLAKKGFRKLARPAPTKVRFVST